MKRKTGPALITPDPPNEPPTIEADTSLSDASDTLSASDGWVVDEPSWDDIARQIDGTFVILVRTRAGSYRRRCFLTVAAAERAAARARGRGESATIVLAELRPVYRIGGKA